MKRIILLVGLVLLLAVPGGAVLADSFDTVIEAGEVVNNDVIIFEGDLAVEAGAVVNGDVIVFNGDATLEGTVNGDVVLFNGDLEAVDAAQISGDCVLLNGTLDDESDGGVSCTNIEAMGFAGFMNDFRFDAPSVPQFQPPDLPVIPTPQAPEPPKVPVVPPAPVAPPVRWEGNDGGGFWGNAFGVLSSTLLAGLIGFVGASLFPRQLAQVKSTLRAKPVVSGGVGLLTAVAVPSVAVLLLLISAVLIIVCIGLLGFPLVFLLMLAFALAIVMGWVAMGAWLGGRLFARKGRSFALTTALGTMVLTFGLGVLGLIPFVFGETLLSLLVAAAGLGAVALTQFGTKPYPRDGSGERESYVTEDDEKVSAVLETLHIEVDDEGLVR